jgi:acetyl-CoA carboxylase carboxyltransferase component
MTEHGAGRLTGRQRIERLFDHGAPVVEYGAQAGPFEPGIEAPGDGVIVALGAVGGRTTVAICCDAAIADGTPGVTGHMKIERGIDLAAHLQAPVVQILEGGAHRPGEPPYYAERRDLVHGLSRLSGRVPIVGLALGAVCGTLAVQLGLSDATVAGPETTITMEEPGDLDDDPAPDAAALERSGAVDLVVGDDGEAVAAARRYLDLVGRPVAPYERGDEPETAAALRAVVPENPRRAMDGRRLIGLVLDPESELRLRERFGGALQTSLGRVGGRAVGVIASHSMVNAAAIDSPASDKLVRFLRLCDIFGLPVVYLTDVPGLFSGPVAEQTAMNRHSTRPYFAQVHSRVPQLAVIVRRAYGQGMIVMGMGGQVRGRALQVVWPTAQFGGMGLGGAAAITSRSSSAARSGDGRTERELYDELVDHGSAARLAERFGTDELIEPGQTRERLLDAVALLPVLGLRQPAKALDSW